MRFALLILLAVIVLYFFGARFVVRQAAHFGDRIKAALTTTGRPR